MRSTRLHALAMFIVVAGNPLRLAAQTEEAGQSRERPAVVEFYAEEEELRRQVEDALAHNPAIQREMARYRARAQEAPEIGGFPDPVFTFTQSIRGVETRVGPVLNQFVFSQVFPWFGTLDQKGKLAVQEAAAQYQIFLAQQREVIFRVKRAFYELGYVDEALRIAEQEQSLLEHYEGLAGIRYASGEGLQHAVIKLQAEITRAMNRQEMLRRQRQSLIARLNTLADRPPQTTIDVVTMGRPPEVALELDRLYELGEENRQELKAATALIGREEEAIDLAKRDRWPDLMVSAALINIGDRDDAPGIIAPPPDNGRNAFNLSFGVGIPLWGRKYDASVQRASEDLLAERMNYANLRNDLEFSIRDAVLRIETLREQSSLFENVLIAQAEEALRATEAAYETGQLGVLDLLDSERVLLEVRVMTARFRSDHFQALASLERALGTKFPN